MADDHAKNSWRDEGVRLLRLANEIATDRPKEEFEIWTADEPDYSGLRISMLYSPEFRTLEWKPCGLYDYLSMADFVRDVAHRADSISLHNHSNREIFGFCSTLAYASFLGYPPDGIAGLEAMKRLCGGKYSVSGVSLRILARIACQPIPEDFIISLTELDSEDITQIKSRGARIVWFARRLLENLSLMTEEEKERYGGIVAFQVFCDQVITNGDGVIDATPYFWEADRLVEPRRIIPDPAEVELLIKKYEIILAKSADDWDFIGKLLDFAPHPEWESAMEIFD